MVFENVEDQVDNSLWLRDVSREQQLQLMAWLDAGQVDQIRALVWEDE